MSIIYLFFLFLGTTNSPLNSHIFSPLKLAHGARNGLPLSSLPPLVSPPLLHLLVSMPPFDSSVDISKNTHNSHNNITKNQTKPLYRRKKQADKR